MLRSAVLFVAVVLTLGIAGTATAAAPTPEPVWCGLTLSVDEIKGHPEQTGFTLWADETPGLASGEIVFFAGPLKYRVAFTDLVAANRLDVSQPPTPLVVAFDAPTRVDSAYVSRFDGNACIVQNPWVRTGLLTGAYSGPPPQPYGPNWHDVARHFFDGVTPIAAPVPEPAELPACPHPYVAPSTRDARQVPTPKTLIFQGQVVLRIRLRADSSIAGMRFDEISRIASLNDAVTKAAEHSTFNAQIYRCAPVAGTYDFVFEFV